MTSDLHSTRPRPASFSLAAGSPLFDRASSSMLALALLFSVALAGLTANRLVRVERDFQPALVDVRRLNAALEATRVLLRDSRLGTSEARIARADTQAQRFHDIATASRSAEQRTRFLAMDDAFAAYYVAARRAAAGLSMSADADGSSAEDASLGYLMLRQSLSAGIAMQVEAIEATRTGTAPVELAGWLTLAILMATALARRHAPRRQDWPVAAESSARTLDDVYLPIPAGEGPAAIRLHDAVERMARKRLAASVAAARVAKRNNERQVELARTWNAPRLSIVPPSRGPESAAASQVRVEMDVYEHDEPEPDYYRGLSLMTV
jgi:hypothetical protein